MRRKKRENFTRRRCWWSERRNERGMRDSETKRKTEKERERQKKTKGGRKTPNGTQREKRSFFFHKGRTSI